MKKLFFTTLSIAILAYSCQKNEILTTTKDKVQTNHSSDQEEITQNKELINASLNIHDANDIMSSSPLFDMKNLDKVFANADVSIRSDETAWAIGTYETSGNGRVFKSTDQGQSWQEPNSAARLKFVEIAKDQSVWGVTSNKKIWKWNGSSWNLKSGYLDQISAISSSSAIGTYNGNIYVTYNNGSNWYQFTTLTNVNWVSAGVNTNTIWVVRTNNVGQKVVNRWNPQNLVWDYYSSYGTNNVYVSAMDNVGAWKIDNTNQIMKSDNGYGFTTPNSSASGYKIAGVDEDVAWVLGASKRIFRTTNGGLSWQEPNTSAGAAWVSAN